MNAPREWGGKVTVCGSTNNDLIVSGPRLPLAGETIAHDTFAQCFGGKGANQAVQAARLGANVEMVAMVGDDEFGASMRANFDSNGVGRAHVASVAGTPTGCALITVGRAERTNTIVIVAGANGAMTPRDVVAARTAIERCDVLLCQMEIPAAATLEALSLCRAAGGFSVLNTAPVPPGGLDDALLRAADVVCPNEVELSLLTGVSGTSEPAVAVQAARVLLARGCKSVLATLGARGCVLVDDSSAVFVPAVAVDAVDTTGAGDSFLGGFAHYVSRGKAPLEAARSAQRVAALSVARAGTQPSYPSANELQHLPALAPLDLAALRTYGAQLLELRDDGSLAPL